MTDAEKLTYIKATLERLRERLGRRRFTNYEMLARGIMMMSTALDDIEAAVLHDENSKERR